MSARASGRGGKAGRRRCGRMSTTCFACCRSSRPSSNVLAARPEPSSATGCRTETGIAGSGRRAATAIRAIGRRRQDAAGAAGIAQGRGEPADRAVRRDGRYPAQPRQPAARPVADRAERARDGRGGRRQAGRTGPRSSSTPRASGGPSAQADAALCASGTVSLELALAGVPLVSCYRLDWIARQLSFLVTSWSASLPNLIADRPIVPEFYDLHSARSITLATSRRCFRIRRCGAGSSTASTRSGGDCRPTGHPATSPPMSCCGRSEKRVASSE